MSNLLAQQIIINPSGAATGVGISGPLQGINKLGDFISIIVNMVVYPIAGVILLFILIWGGFDILMAQGDPDKVNAGRNKITSAIVGFILLVLSYFFARLIGYIFNVGGTFF
jgi:hypothetical protein